MSFWTDTAFSEHCMKYHDAMGIRTRCLEAGKGAPLILLHGVGGHLEAYARNIEAHARHYRVYALDMLGHGFTDKPDKNYEIDDYIEHLRGFCDSLGLERIRLSGESLGGWVAARFAIKYPKRVDKLVLNTAGGLTADPAVMERIYTLTMRAVREPDRDNIRKRLEWLMADPASVTDELVELRFRIYSQPGFADVMERIMCLQFMDTRRRNLLQDGELRSISAPTLVIWTTHDPTAPVAVGQRFADLIPNARLVVMDDCGHWPQYEKAEEFNRIHIDFLAA
jgi:2-hydroxy-6-oxonona-2,4-dienedioate hydrolase